MRGLCVEPPRATSPALPEAAMPQSIVEVVPTDVQTYMASYLNNVDVASFGRTCKAANFGMLHDAAWRGRYAKRFGTTGPFQGTTGPSQGTYSAFIDRSRIPHVGDEVQVMWEGNFNLVSDNELTSYKGRAWWNAKIVGYSTDAQGAQLFRVHYDEWESSTWDEEVPRDRIRFKPQLVDTDSPLAVGDRVEFRCPSSFGRTPWLECVAARKLLVPAVALSLQPDGVQDGSLDAVLHEYWQVGDIAVGQQLAVPRQSLRFVSRESGGRNAPKRKVRQSPRAAAGGCGIM